MKKLLALFACMLALTSCLEHLLGDDDDGDRYWDWDNNSCSLGLSVRPVKDK